MATPMERWTPAGPIRSPIPMDVIEQEEARAAASVGEAAPLGLFGFASGTFTLSAVNAGWFPAAAAIFAIPVVLIFGGIAQFIAAMWSYRKGDTFAATAFGSFGAFNVMYSVFILLRQAGLIVGSSAGTGVVGIAVACFSLIAIFLTLAAMRQNMALTGVLFFLAWTYGLIAVGMITGAGSGWLFWGGWAGLISSVLAFYTAGAMVINSVSKQEVLPLGSTMGTSSRRTVDTVEVDNDPRVMRREQV